METIGTEKLFSFRDDGVLGEMSNRDIRLGRGCEVRSYLELATKVAELQFKNPNYVMLFRGQRADYLRSDNTRSGYSTLKPTLFRGTPPPHDRILERRFSLLANAERELVAAYDLAGFPAVERIRRQRILRWSILQHYEVCDTPLLDVTQSLRIAASFASIDAHEEAFIFVLGVPNVSGAITASAEAGLQIVRLSSVCPPSAVRPHIQEGYLLGEYPEMSGYDQKQSYSHFEIDFGRRVVAKFRFNPTDFEGDRNFRLLERPALYPDQSDPIFRFADAIKRQLR
jgi:hypothetical protein